MHAQRLLFITLLLLFLTGLLTCTKVEVYTLDTSVTPAEGGIVEPMPGGYDEGIELVFHARPSGDYIFDHWEGDLEGTRNPQAVEISSNMEVGAVFALKTYSLKVATQGEGTVDEQVVAGDSTYEHGTRVQLTATPNEGWRFDHWEGDLQGDTNPVSLTVVNNQSVTAVFELQEYPFSTTIEGMGTIQRSPDQLIYKHFDSVTLTAVPEKGWQFNRWEGDLEGNANPDSLVIDDSLSVTAVFSFIEKPPTVKTSFVSNIQSFIAKSGGDVVSDGGAEVTERGVCWSKSPGPTLADNCSQSGLGTGSFVVSMSYLDPASTYYVRAYATNEVATAYGSDFSFTTDNPSDPYSFLLSWQRDPTTTMTIDWHTDDVAEQWMQYRRKGDSQWNTVQGKVSDFPGSERVIRRHEITGLLPNTTYEFRFTGRDVYTFRTLPSQQSRTIRFAAAGDVMHTTQWMSQTAQVAAQYNLDFVMLGGDLAYANGNPFYAGRWYDYLEVWSENMITAGNRVIPHLAAIGNHEVKGAFVGRHPGYEQTNAVRADLAPFFYSLMAFPGQPGYGVLDFGDYMSLIFLDSNHTNPPDGQQAAWLENALASRQDGRHLFPLYHVGAYPSRRQDEITNQLVRQHWVPLFEQYGVRVAFENHNHNYKRTVPLKGGVQSSDGITYMGDGAWGVAIEPSEPYSYFAKTAQVHHFILVEVEGSQIRMRVIDDSGNQIDQVTVDQ
ncbi:MAG: fibronectin type III domain-containing protein [Balneolaceae bacterium]|nr:fibronectin type III domain-containing protein [Balneolaceae bacterium]